jgi:hypothetical protein
MPFCGIAATMMMSHRSYIPGRRGVKPLALNRDNRKVLNELPPRQKVLIDRSGQKCFFDWRSTAMHFRLRMMRCCSFRRHTTRNLAAHVGCARKELSIRT